MNKDENINVLNEINKGACMGEDAINFIIDKIQDKSLYNVVDSLKKEYQSMIKEVESMFKDYAFGDAQETNKMEKMMTWYGIETKTLMDDSSSKISQLLIEGLNMGIIEGRKLLNRKDMDKRIHKLVDKYVSIQESALDSLKEYL